MRFRRTRPSKLHTPPAAIPRFGVAVIELAICLPVLMLLLLATVEASVMLQLKQNLTVIAYEGARVGILPGSTSGQVYNQCTMLLDDRDIEMYSITTVPADPSAALPGDTFEVQITADCAANAVFGGFLYEGKTIEEKIVMLKE